MPVIYFYTVIIKTNELRKLFKKFPGKIGTNFRTHKPSGAGSSSSIDLT